MQNEKPNQAQIHIYSVKEDLNKLIRLLFGLFVPGVMSNTVRSETFMPLGEIICAGGA